MCWLGFAGHRFASSLALAGATETTKGTKNRQNRDSGGAARMSVRVCHQRLTLRQPARRQPASQQLADAHIEASQGDGFDQVGGQLCQSAHLARLAEVDAFGRRDLGHLTAWCEHHNIPYQGVPVGTIKKHATGKGNAGKDEMITSVRERGHTPVDDNEADALALLHWAIETQEV